LGLRKIIDRENGFINTSGKIKDMIDDGSVENQSGVYLTFDNLFLLPLIPLSYFTLQPQNYAKIPM